MPTHTYLRLDSRAAWLSNRTLNALNRGGIKTWDDLVKEAQRVPNVLGHMPGLGRSGMKEIKVALDAAKVETTFRAGRHR